MTPTGSRPPPRSISGSRDLAKLTVAQAALLAGLPKSPIDARPVPLSPSQGRPEAGWSSRPRAPPVVRRDWILARARDGRPLDEARHGRAAGRPGRAGHPRRRAAASATRAVTSRGRSGASCRSILGPDADLKRGGYRVITTLDWKAQQLAERWMAAAAIAPNLKRNDRRQAMLNAAQDPATRPDLDQRPARQGPPQRGDRRPRLPDRRCPRLRRQRRLRPGRHRELGSSIPSTTPPATGAASPARPSSRSSTPSAFDARRLTPGSLLLDVTTRVRPPPGVGPARRRPAGARTRPGAEGAAVLAEHPGHPGPRAGRQRARRRHGRSDGPPVHGRRDGVPAGRAGGRDRHGRGPAARPDAPPTAPSPTAASGCRRGWCSRSGRPTERSSGARRRPRAYPPSAPRRPISSRTSWPATRTRPRTTSGPRNSSCATRRTVGGGRRPPRPGRPTTPVT